MSHAAWDVVIGIETHVQLSTASKIFSRASTQFSMLANTNINVIDIALPGTLPVMNTQAVTYAIQFGLAVEAHIAPLSQFERKNYFYPDLPKGYQISQYQTPIVQGGSINFNLEGQRYDIALTRAHLEEDAGKSVHDALDQATGIDLNRAGTPLLEIVSEPVLHSSAQASSYAKALHRLVVWLGICDGNMQEGSMRMDANVSIKPRGSDKLGTRTEIKNLNSFRFLEQAIDYEVSRQIELLEDGKTITQETRLFSAHTGQTRSMRSKEDAHDYRYFPDPDLPPLMVSNAQIDEIKSAMPELPEAMMHRLMHAYALSTTDAQLMTQTKAHADYFAACMQQLETPDIQAKAKLIVNWITGELAAHLNRESLEISATKIEASLLAQLIEKIASGQLNHQAAKQVFASLWQNAQQDIDTLAKTLAVTQNTDIDAMTQIAQEALAKHMNLLQDYRQGKSKALNALVGKVMQMSQGKADPQQAKAILLKLIEQAH